MIITLIYCYVFLRDVNRIRHITQWPKTTGNITRSHVYYGIAKGPGFYFGQRPGQFSVEYTYEVKYEYYSGNRRKIIGGHFNFQFFGLSSAEKLQEKYFKGRYVQVYFDPINPSFSILELDWSKIWFLVRFLVIIPLLIATTYTLRYYYDPIINFMLILGIIQLFSLPILSRIYSKYYPKLPIQYSSDEVIQESLDPNYTSDHIYAMKKEEEKVGFSVPEYLKSDDVRYCEDCNGPLPKNAKTCPHCFDPVGKKRKI
jgi:hypothetical protein